MDRRQFLGAPLATSLQLGAGAAAGKPNFLIIMSDQHSPHVMGCRGDPVVKTPHLDRLASRGILFENAYCQSPICVPSRMSFLTGAQPSEIDVWTNADTLPSDVPTFAHALTAAGYDTALIGRMHFLGADQSHGFSSVPVRNITPIYPQVPHVMPPALFPGAGGNSRAGVQIAGPGRTAYQAYDEEVTRAAVDFLKSKATRAEQPWCAVVGMVLPHAPYICRKSDWDYYYNRVTIPEMPPGYFENLHPAMQAWRRTRGIEDMPVEEIRRARAGYYGLVTHFDRLAGEILETLEKSGLDRNTVVIYTADHGDMAGELGMWWKNSFYQGSAGVPLIVSHPGFRSGRRVRQAVSLIDIAPTLTGMAGAPALPDASGHSLTPLLEGREAGWKDEAFSEFPATKGVPAMRMIRSGRWKLIHYEGMRPQLFDLEVDPRELRDLGESEAHRAVRERLHRRVRGGWDALRMEAALARRAKRSALLRHWAVSAKPQSPLQWTPPAGATLFPEK